MKTPRVYEKSFKENAVRLCEYSPIVQVARELGINESMLRRWRKEYRDIGSCSFSGKGNKNITSEEREIENMKKTIYRLETENAILKKAMGIISKSDL